MMPGQEPDIGAMIFRHTADSHVVELPFGLGEWQLPTTWRLFGLDAATGTVSAGTGLSARYPQFH